MRQDLGERHARRVQPETASAPDPRVAVVVVGYRNVADVLGCLGALSRLSAEPPFDVFIAENGGPSGMDGLLAALGAPGGCCRALTGEAPPAWPSRALRRGVFALERQDPFCEARVYLAEMEENLGYGGGVNAWLRPLLTVSGWRGAWVLNPDTEPEPAALNELVLQAARRGKGMVGSRITTSADQDKVRTRGLRWRKLTAQTAAVDLHAPAAVEPDADEVEDRLDAPSGASFYVTRELIERIGLMDERYFLFFEDLEWGARAKTVGQLAHAHRSIVPHRGGTTIGGAGPRAAVSELSVYLEFRNRILFVRERHPKWLVWTALAQLLHAAAFITAGSTANAATAVRGLAAGLRGEVGRPDRLLSAHGRRRTG